MAGLQGASRNLRTTYTRPLFCRSYDCNLVGAEISDILKREFANLFLGSAKERWGDICEVGELQKAVAEWCRFFIAVKAQRSDALSAISKAVTKYEKVPTVEQMATLAFGPGWEFGEVKVSAPYVSIGRILSLQGRIVGIYIYVVDGSARMTRGSLIKRDSQVAVFDIGVPSSEYAVREALLMLGESVPDGVKVCQSLRGEKWPTIWDFDAYGHLPIYGHQSDAPRLKAVA